MRNRLQKHFNEEYDEAVGEYKKKLWKKLPFSKEKVNGLKEDSMLYSICTYMLELRENSRMIDQKPTTQFRKTKKVPYLGQSVSQKYPVDEEIKRAAYEAAGDLVI